MHATDVIGWKYHADIHCTDCAEENGMGDGAIDPEGNESAPVFAGSEFDYPLTCGTCHADIEGATVLYEDGETDGVFHELCSSCQWTVMLSDDPEREKFCDACQPKVDAALEAVS